MGIWDRFTARVSGSARQTRDELFNRVYPGNIREISQKQWTPVMVAEIAASYLAGEESSKILDIGSGVGKFCLTAATYKPLCHYYGIEQRQSLVDVAMEAQKNLGIENVSFLHGNITALDFSQFDHFYFFNSFYEQLPEAGKIANDIEFSVKLYEFYSQQLFDKLAALRPGTRLCTYHGKDARIPASYKLMNAQFDNLLRFWKKG